MNGKRERILREKSHILRKANHYDNLGLNSEALRLEAKRKARKALILGQETARQIGADITKKLSNHNVSILNVENLSWAVGEIRVKMGTLPNPGSHYPRSPQDRKTR